MAAKLPAEESMACSPDIIQLAITTSSATQTAAFEWQMWMVTGTALIRKLDLHLLPGVCTLYLLSFLDRSNVANAKLDGLDADLHMTGNQYLTGLTLFFVGYILFEVFWNVILKRIGPKLWLPSVTIVWGVVTVLQGVIQYNGGQTGVAGFFVVRFMLGVCEGALFPGVVFYLSMWYKRTERQYRIALFFSFASLAGAFGGILAYGIGFMKGVGGLNGWRWIFIIEGLLTVVLGFFAYFFIADWPLKARFVNEDERAQITARLKADSDAVYNEAFSWSNVMLALKDYKVWLYCAGFHTLSLPLYTLSLFLPSIIANLGYKAADAQLLTVPVYALATILTVLYAVVSQKVGARAPFVIIAALCAIIGYGILLGNPHPKQRPGVSYLGTFFAAAGIYPAVGMTLSWPALNVSGQTKRATACALQITIGNLGAVIGTQLYRAGDGPKYTVGHSVACAYMCTSILVSATLFFVLSRENRKRDASGRASERVVYDETWKGDSDVRWRYSR
ncbi:MFS general substrate transporter [Teratosphaeria nubilosa]|uniref:MFS general substrate transporter n=1 Tax=Teratosphaeria nubilosa TaxID=161662 RepID=A0A6G1LD44_9PEZI|nr:MFS general substrate transporter [Teratosphaeria nubilosa]